MMSEKPENPTECPVCLRVEGALDGSRVFHERLSEDEQAELLSLVQSAILNRNITKTTRGIKMSDEKYVISKASFEEFYDTQNTLVAIIEKMVDRIEKQDAVIMKFGAALSDIIAKDMDNMMEDEYVEEEVEDEEIDGADEGVVEDEEEDEVEAPVEEEVVEEEKPAMPMDAMAFERAQKDAFEAGYKSAFAELQKKNGVPVNTGNFSYPESRARPVPTADAKVAQSVESIEKADLPESEIVMMSPAQLNAWMRERKLL